MSGEDVSDQQWPAHWWLPCVSQGDLHWTRPQSSGGTVGPQPAVAADSWSDSSWGGGGIETNISGGKDGIYKGNWMISFKEGNWCFCWFVVLIELWMVSDLSKQRLCDFCHIKRKICTLILKTFFNIERFTLQYWYFRCSVNQKDWNLLVKTSSHTFHDSSNKFFVQRVYG